MKIQPSSQARHVALDLLTRILDQNQLLSTALDTHKQLARLSLRDRAFARLMTTTVLRRKGQIDAIIDQMLARPLPVKFPVLRHILRLGSVQLLFLDTPAHAAIDQTVALTKTRVLCHFSGLVNAVLRRISREGAALMAGQDAACLNLPDWLWQSWIATYGASQTRATALAHLTPPPLDLTVFSSPQNCVSRLKTVLQKDPLPESSSASPLPKIDILPTGGLRLTGWRGPVTSLPGYNNGLWQPQDAAASLPARLLLAALGGGTHHRILDCCAAPGGKTAQLAHAGAQVTALDHSGRRLDRLQENLNRLGLPARIIKADALDWEPPHHFDGILLDAPCSATGSLRRRPDVTWRKTPELAGQRTLLQDQLLEKSLDWLKPGGILVYAVCSLQPEEGRDRIADFLTHHRNLTRSPIAPSEVGDPAFINDRGELLTLPGQWIHQGGIDGFQAVRLVKTS